MNTIETRFARSYIEFMAFTESLVAEGKTTGPDQSDKLIENTRMNLHRMQRIAKTMEILPEVREAFEKITAPHRWVLLAEPWCGDGAQNVPPIAALASLSPNIDLEILLRDENLDLIDLHLTGGGRAIPKLLILDSSGDVVAEWGPRPAPAQQLAAEYKAMVNKPSKEEFNIGLMKWYNSDRTHSIQRELAALMCNI